MSKKLCLLILLALLVGTLNLAMRVDKAEASGTIYIRADGSIEPSDAPISSLDNITYTLTGNITSDVEGIVVERSNMIIDGNGYTLEGTNAYNSIGINVTGRSNITIKNMTIKASYHCIWLVSSSNNSIVGNNITNNNRYGIVLSSSSNNNTISGNNITNNEYGIKLYYSSNYNIISGNNITANDYEGIWLDQSSNYNSISGNNITNNSYDGIYLSDSSNNSISGNNITANSLYGIWLDYSSNNKIFHNNLVNNNIQAHFSGSANVLDDGYPSGGNYWSDCNGTDLHSSPYQNETGSDGINDTSYTIEVNNVDRYPMMGTFYDFSVSWIDSGYSVELISNSSVSAFDVGFWIEHPDDPNTRIVKFNVTGETGTAGFCRICIPTALLNASYKVLLNGTEIPSTLLPSSNSTHSYLYFNYTHSTKEVTITPEFPSFLILPLFMVATLLAAIFYRRKHEA